MEPSRPRPGDHLLPPGSPPNITVSSELISDVIRWSTTPPQSPTYKYCNINLSLKISNLGASSVVEYMLTMCDSWVQSIYI